MSIEDALESQIKKNKLIQEKGKALERLLKSQDFQLVILSGFLREHALDLVYSRANSNEIDDSISRKIDGIAQFKAFLDKVLEEAEIASKDIEQASDDLYHHRNEV